MQTTTTFATIHRVVDILNFKTRHATKYEATLRRQPLSSLSGEFFVFEVARVNSASFKKLSELFFSELQLADIQPHRAARDCLISVWFVEGYDRGISINIYEISSRAALLVLRRPVAK